MTVTPEEFDSGLKGYVVDKFIPALENPMTRFLLGAASGADALRLDAFGGLDALRRIGAVCEDGRIDLDVLRKVLGAGFAATVDGKLPVRKWGLGLSLDKGDAEGLLSYMEKAATPAPTEKAA